MKKMMKNEKGFTLIELIIVIAILAIIAAIAIPNILGAVDNSRRSTDVANAKIILNAAAQVNAKNDDIPVVEGVYVITTDSITGSNIGTAATATATAIAGTVFGATTDGLAFAEKLFLELNNSGPTPKYKGNAATSFRLVVESDGLMTVDNGGGEEVAPNPDSTYTQN